VDIAMARACKFRAFLEILRPVSECADISIHQYGRGIPAVRRRSQEA